MGFYSNMADTTNATYSGGIIAPHFSLSVAKISINPETSKPFTKNNRSRPLKPASETY
jgi:hypothetical protein